MMDVTKTHSRVFYSCEVPLLFPCNVLHTAQILTVFLKPLLLRRFMLATTALFVLPLCIHYTLR